MGSRVRNRSNLAGRPVVSIKMVQSHWLVVPMLPGLKLNLLTPLQHIAFASEIAV